MEMPIEFDPAIHSHLIPSIVKIHMDCITQPPYTIATFIPPLDASRMQTWWESRVQEIKDGSRVLIIQLANNPTSGEKELAGYVALSMPETETGPFRGGVEKLLVSPDHRQKGVARAVMLKLEEVARAKGRTMLTLDTITGSPAELVYPRLGYDQIGIIPEYGISPYDKSLAGATLFYKNLLKQS